MCLSQNKYVFLMNWNSFLLIRTRLEEVDVWHMAKTRWSPQTTGRLRIKFNDFLIFAAVFQIRVNNTASCRSDQLWNDSCLVIRLLSWPFSCGLHVGWSETGSALRFARCVKNQTSNNALKLVLYSFYDFVLKDKKMFVSVWSRNKISEIMFFLLLSPLHFLKIFIGLQLLF